MANPRHTRSSPGRGLSGLSLGALVVVFVLGGLLVVFLSSRGGETNRTGSARAGAFAFDVGRPGPGDAAPAVDLSSTAGGSLNLAALRGHKVLLYFQEGLSCQPCWDQLSDIQKYRSSFRALGIDRIISITSDPLGDLRQKVSDERLSIPVLSDPDLRVSKQYHANSYGMMGSARDGHTFVLVDEQGMIEWRADYGGAPDYTMYVPPRNLLADLRKGIRASTPTSTAR